MGNCLITKLKVAVDNGNLLGIGEYKMHINLSSAKSDVKMLGSGGTITILGSNEYYFTKNGQQTKTINYSNVVATWPAGEYDVLFTNKYALIGCDGAMGIDLEVFAFSDRLFYIGAIDSRGNIDFLEGKTCGSFALGGNTNQGVTGHLSVLVSAVANHTISIGHSSIAGNIALLGNSGSKSISVVYCPYITGSIEGLVAALVSDPVNPFTSGSKTVGIARSNVTINGQLDKIADEVINLIMEDATHWYYPSNSNDKIDNPSYNVTIYAKNPTAEQITAWEANNNTVVVLS